MSTISDDFPELTLMDRASEIGELLDEAQSKVNDAQVSLQELTEQIMKVMDEYVPVDEQLFIDDDADSRGNPEADEDWKNQWFKDTKDYLEKHLRLQLVSMDDDSIASHGSSVGFSETKAEDNVFEEKKADDDTVSTLSADTLCQICHDTLKASLCDHYECRRCCKVLHRNCYNDLRRSGSNKCPSCRMIWNDPHPLPQVIMFFIKNVVFFF